MGKYTKCQDCGTEVAERLYSSGSTPYCKDCKRYRNLSDNSGVVRKRITTPQLSIERKDFLEWTDRVERRCYYCGILETELPSIGLQTQIGRKLEALGVDRLDSTKDYTIDNVVLCCFACNKVKGNVFTPAEMKIIGKAINEVWQQRIANANPA